MTRGRRSVLIPAAQEILKEYDIRITLRQLFYRLVSKGIIKNSLTSYNMLIQQMTIARRDHRIPFEVFEDRTRHSVEGEHPLAKFDSEASIFDNAKYTYEHASEIALDQLTDAYLDYSLPYWHKQPFYVEVWLEKEALANLFESICEKYHVSFVPCRGYPSLSLLYDCSKRLGSVPVDRETRILYFGDFDMRGLNIEETIEKNLLNDFHIQAKVIRYALTKDQIQQYELPPSPAKQTDTMARGWIETHGDVAWELDAIEPHTLKRIVEQAVLEQIDQDVLEQRNRTIEEKREWIREQANEFLEQEP